MCCCWPKKVSGPLNREYIFSCPYSLPIQSGDRPNHVRLFSDGTHSTRHKAFTKLIESRSIAFLSLVAGLLSLLSHLPVHFVQLFCIPSRMEKKLLCRRVLWRADGDGSAIDRRITSIRRPTTTYTTVKNFFFLQPFRIVFFSPRSPGVGVIHRHWPQLDFPKSPTVYFRKK